MANEKIMQKILDARAQFKEKKFEETKKSYEDALELLEENFKNENTNFHKVRLLTTKAEYYHFRGIVLFSPDETWNEAREYMIKALQSLNEAKNSCEIESDKNRIEQDMEKLVQQIIQIFGCKIPESQTHYHIKCPIKLRQMFEGAGLGTGMSPGLIFKNPTCSICKKNIVECKHTPGKIYDGIEAKMDYKDIEVNHIAIVKNPKDPHARIREYSVPKSDFDRIFSKEELDKKAKNGLPLICHYCRDNKVDSTEINFETFIEMQILSSSAKNSNDQKSTITGFLPLKP